MQRNFFDDDEDDDEQQLHAGDTSAFSTSHNTSFAPAANADDSFLPSTSYRASSVSADLPPVSRDRRSASAELEEILGKRFASKKERNVQRLIRAWTNESNSPELLVFPRELVEQFVKDLVRRRAVVQRAGTQIGQPEGFYVTATLIATENMRAAHVLKSFLRERLYKIERFARFYVHQYNEANEKPELERTREDQDALLRMHGNELAHAQEYVRITNDYFKTAVVDSMPDQVAVELDDVDNHPRPDFSQPVFIRVKRDCGDIVLPNEDVLHLEKDSQHMLRYSTIRSLLRKDWVELI